MTVYERIKTRRKELGLSADDVAQALGVSRATIYRYESAEVEKVPITVLEPLARVLQTTPSYLMGWEIDSAAPGGLPDPAPTPVIRRIARAGERMSAAQQEKLLQLAEIMFPEYFDPHDGNA